VSPIISGGGGGGAGSSTLLQLFDATLGADAASIDTGAAGIAQTANHLLVMLYLRSTQAIVGANVNVTLNGDGAAHYDRVNITGNSTAATTSAGASESAIGVPLPGASVASATLFGPALLLIPSYRQTTGDKLVIPIAGYADATITDSIVQVRPTHWQSSAAISQITVAAQVNNLKAGSRMTIYGLV
jgi:hypothetical protein